MATLQDIATKFAEENKESSPAQVAINWEALSNHMNSPEANSGRGYADRTIVNFTTKVRKAMKKAGAQKEAVEKIETIEGLRQATRRMDKIAKDRFALGKHRVTIDNPKALIEEAVDICKSSVYVGDLIAALGILTGRRCAKIAQLSAKYEFKVIDEKHIEFYNLLKGGMKEVVVPILGSVEAVIEGINALNQILPEDVEFMETEDIKKRYQSNASKSAKKILSKYLKGGKHTMHTTRKVYTAVCMERVYGKSDILPASRSAFITHILGHTSKNFDENYDFIQIGEGYEW